MTDARAALEPPTLVEIRHALEIGEGNHQFGSDYCTTANCSIAGVLARLPADAAPVDAERPDGAALIAAERRRQIVEEGYDEDHDRYGSGELARAAACYALAERGLVPTDWPWDAQFWKPTADDRVRELTKGGALIAAAIDVLLAEARDDAALAPSET